MRKYLNIKYNTSSWLVSTIRGICAKTEPTPAAQEFRFEISPESAAHNMNMIKQHKWNYKKAVKAQKGTRVTPGFEFHEIDTIKKVWGDRMDWHNICRIIKKGCFYPLAPGVPEKVRKSDVVHMYNVVITNQYLLRMKSRLYGSCTKRKSGRASSCPFPLIPCTTLSTFNLPHWVTSDKDPSMVFHIHFSLGHF